MTSEYWEKHYQNKRSELNFPDENLVRLLNKFIISNYSDHLYAVDLGCGSGRHLKLLNDLGIANIIGMDSSITALNISGKHFNCPLVQNDNLRIPLKNNSIDIFLAWGSLHYNTKSDLHLMLDEIRRILNNEGQLFATLRSANDTYLKRGKHIGNDTWITDLDDLDGSTVSFFNEPELEKAFSNFTFFEYGLIERSLIGDTKKIISHWVVHAKK